MNGVEVTQADDHLAQVISVIYDKPIRLEEWDGLRQLLSRHRIVHQQAAIRAAIEAVPRYESYAAGDGDQQWPYFEENSEGEWVKYADLLALTADQIMKGMGE